MHLPPEIPRDELDFQLSPSRIAKDAMAVLQRHQAETAALDARPDAQVVRDLPYGPGPRQKLDICTPGTRGDLPCLVFIHGGFWQEGSKAGSGFAADACLAAGWAHVGIGYTLAPEARLSDIVAEIGQALAVLHRVAPEHGIDPARIVVAGHSAGGHLVAAIMAGLGGETATAAAAGAVLVSGVYELAPIAKSYVNDLVQMDAQEVAELSPMRRKPLRDIPTLILIGGDESDAFQWQSATLADEWRPRLSRLEVMSLPGRDHFDILDALADPSGPVFQSIREMVA